MQDEITIRCKAPFGCFEVGKEYKGTIKQGFMGQTRVSLPVLPTWTAHPTLFFNSKGEPDAAGDWLKFEIVK